jgi:hypothetical protein
MPRDAPAGSSGAPATSKGPSTVLSVPPASPFTASTSIETPSTSDSSMNSCLASVQAWPVSVRKRSAAIHSAAVGRTSRISACECRTTAETSSISRGLASPAVRASTASVAEASSKSGSGMPATARSTRLFLPQGKNIVHTRERVRSHEQR